MQSLPGGWDLVWFDQATEKMTRARKFRSFFFVPLVYAFPITSKQEVNCPVSGQRAKNESRATVTLGGLLFVCAQERNATMRPSDFRNPSQPTGTQTDGFWNTNV